MKSNPEGQRNLDSEDWSSFLDLINLSLFLPNGELRDNAWEIILNAMTGKSTPISEAELATLETEPSAIPGAIAAGAGIGTAVGAGAATFVWGVAAVMGSSVGLGPLGLIVGAGILIGAGIGALIGGISDLIEEADYDEKLANFIVVADQLLSEDSKKILFGKIGAQAKTWLQEDSDGITETKADNEDKAMEILNKF